jgi:hypothetical protein
VLAASVVIVMMMMEAENSHLHTRLRENLKSYKVYPLHFHGEKMEDPRLYSLQPTDIFHRILYAV